MQKAPSPKTRGELTKLSKVSTGLRKCKAVCCSVPYSASSATISVTATATAARYVENESNARSW